LSTNVITFMLGWFCTVNQIIKNVELSITVVTKLESFFNCAVLIEKIPGT